ncbi:MAG: hypothetical protein E6J24_02430, partial [Chloroflexi bacterium]
MRAEILSIGTELLLGQIVDTNAHYLAGRLADLGIDCLFISTVGDNLGRTTELMRRALERSDLVITSGGLGPTEDDLTRETIAAVLGETPQIDPELERQLRAWFAARNVSMPERNRKQAWLIPSARAIPNPNGTAPGWDVRREGKRIVSMPGVPREMTHMWEHHIEPTLIRDARLRSRTLKILGVGESQAEETLAELVRRTTAFTSASPTRTPIRRPWTRASRRWRRRSASGSVSTCGAPTTSSSVTSSGAGSSRDAGGSRRPRRSPRATCRARSRRRRVRTSGSRRASSCRTRTRRRSRARSSTPRRRCVCWCRTATRVRRSASLRRTVRAARRSASAQSPRAGDAPG